MTTNQTAVLEAAAEEPTFQARKILQIAGGHFVHDTYTAFVSPLLPLLIERLSLSLTQAGSLAVFLQLPALLNIFIGYMADRISLRYFIIFAPAATATLITVLGLMPGYVPLAILLFVTGISVALFHVPAPALIGQISGRRVGRGMSFFMAGGEMGRTVGPLLVVWAVGLWGLDGIWRLAIIGWLTTAFLFWRLHNFKVKTKHQERGSFRQALPRMRRLFVPLSAVMFLRSFVVTGLSIYMVVYLTGKGYSLANASQALALLEFAGIGGALTGGTLSDRIGRRRMMVVGIMSSALLLQVMLNVDGVALIPVLILMGFTGLAVTPVIQAMVQENLVENRAMANGMFMFVAFLARSLATLLIGSMGDAIGLQSAYVVCTGAALLSLPLIYLLPASAESQPV